MTPNDTIELHYQRNYVTEGGTVVFTRDQTVLKDNIQKEMTVNEAVIFEVEKGDFGEKVKQGIGGAFLEVGK